MNDTRIKVILWRIRNLYHRLRGIKQEFKCLARIGIRSALYLKITRADGSVENYGLVSHRVVTDAGVAILAIVGHPASEFNYHDCGTGNTAENKTDVALVTPYGGGRAVGTQSTSTNVLQSVGTISFSSTLTIVEHGIFNATSGVTLLDRTVHASQVVNSGDTITYTYQLTLPSNG